VILQTLGAIFSNPTTLGAICAQIFRDFAKVFIDFTQIYTYFSRIFKDFARVFNIWKLLGVHLHSLHPLLLYH